MEISAWILTGDVSDEEIAAGVEMIIKAEILTAVYLSKKEALDGGDPDDIPRHFTATISVDVVSQDDQ